MSKIQENLLLKYSDLYFLKSDDCRETGKLNLSPVCMIGVKRVVPSSLKRKSMFFEVGILKGILPAVSISSCQRNLIKNYHNEANPSRITKNALKNFLDFFGRSR